MGFVREWQAMRRFNSLSAEQRRIVFYSEGPAYWVHFEPVIRHLLEDQEETVCYLSSGEDDPGLGLNHPRLLGFHIGESYVRTILFRSLQATVMVMSMPDFQTFHIKRSSYPVHYVYLNHSMVSTHTTVREGAFDHFDSFFCVGPHQAAEIRETERVYGSPAKNLVEHGFGRLDSILAENRASDAVARSGEGPFRVLVAPSWGPEGMFETPVGGEVIGNLLEAGLRVTMRPHPHTRNRTPHLVDMLAERFGDNENFSFDGDITSEQALHEADIMVSDWSGAAIEFAFGLERPVLFVDIPRKVINPHWERIGMPPKEDTIRGEIGEIVTLDRLAEIGAAVRGLAQRSGEFRQRIRETRGRTIYNVGRSGAVGARRIVEIADGLLH